MSVWSSLTGMCVASLALAACSSARRDQTDAELDAGLLRDAGPDADSASRDARVPRDATSNEPGPRTFRELWRFERDGLGSAVTPLVANLNDDNRDGRIDACDDADVILVGLEESGVAYLRFLSGLTGQEQVRSAEPVTPYSTPAVGDLDDDGVPEVVALTPDGRLSFFDGSGALLRQGDAYDPFEAAYGALALANLDGEGAAEVVFGNSTFDAQGKLLRRLDDTLDNAAGYGHATVAVDLDGDGLLEVVLGRSAFHHDGQPYYRHADLSAGLPAVADLDGDGSPEITLQSEEGTTVLDHTGAIRVRAQRPLSALRGAAAQQRPACIADLDSDGRPELGVSSGTQFGVLRADTLAPVWQHAIVDESGGSGCAALTGADPMLFYFDETAYYAYAADGKVLTQGVRSSVTAIEVPAVADLDGDGSAEILIVGGPNLSGVQAAPALRVVSMNAVRRPVRRIWNQHTYHITNVQEDGRIPTRERAHWLGDNTFRANGFVDDGAPRCRVDPLQ